jgi:hypothetical protein
VNSSAHPHQDTAALDGTKRANRKFAPEKGGVNINAAAVIIGMKCVLRDAMDSCWRVLLTLAAETIQ